MSPTKNPSMRNSAQKSIIFRTACSGTDAQKTDLPKDRHIEKHPDFMEFPPLPHQRPVREENICTHEFDSKDSIAQHCEIFE